jgi:nucleoside-diphosphate-sugar epimerase
VKFTTARSYDVNKFYANPEKARKKLGFSPKIKIEKGIELAIKELESLVI